ncbi:MAG: hypothetical protein JSU86_01975, partial [Phycisphaerales bacterium]
MLANSRCVLIHLVFIAPIAFPFVAVAAPDSPDTAEEGPLTFWGENDPTLTADPKYADGDYMVTAGRISTANEDMVKLTWNTGYPPAAGDTVTISVRVLRNSGVCRLSPYDSSNTIDITNYVDQTPCGLTPCNFTFTLTSGFVGALADLGGGSFAMRYTCGGSALVDRTEVSEIRADLTLPPVLSSYSNTQESSTTDGTDTDTFVLGTSLAAGVDHLVIYHAGYGGAGSSDDVGARIEFGSTVIGRSVDEGSSSGIPEAVRFHQLSGFYIVTGNGTDELRIKHEVVIGTSYIKGKGIIAIPLDSLTETSDYWQSLHNSDTEETSTSGVWVNVRDVTFNLPEDGDYLVLASMEATMSAGADTGGASMRLQIASTTQKMEWAKEWETNSMSQNFAYARIHTLTAGNNTFTLQGGVSQGSNTAGFRRSRIIVVRASAFNQMTSTTTDAQSTTADTFEVSGAQLGWDDWLTNTYTPNQPEYVVVIGNGFAWQGQNNRSTAARIENKTDAIVFSEFACDDAKDITVDRATHLVTASERISAGKTYALQMSNEDSTSTGSQRLFGDLIVWSMRLSGCVDNADCEDNNECTTDICNAGTCENNPVTDGTSCDDGQACFEGETCQSGTCTGAVAVDCSGTGDQ